MLQLRNTLECNDDPNQMVSSKSVREGMDGFIFLWSERACLGGLTGRLPQVEYSVRTACLSRMDIIYDLV
jgi:hypothetical protein